MVTTSTEYIQFKIEDENQEQFLRAVSKASKILVFNPECFGVDLNRCEEDSSLFIWKVNWSTKEASLDGFKNTKVYVTFCAALQPFCDNIVKSGYYKRLSLTF